MFSLEKEKDSQAIIVEGERCCTWPEGRGQRWRDQWLPDSLRVLLVCFCYQQLVATKYTKSWCVSRFAGDLDNLLWHPTLLWPLHPLVCVTLCPWTDVMQREPGSYTILHSVTLQWPVACRPPGRMASLLNHNPVILPELGFQNTEPSLCTAPTQLSGMSPNLFFFLSLRSPFLPMSLGMLTGIFFFPR